MITPLLFGAPIHPIRTKQLLDIFLLPIDNTACRQMRISRHWASTPKSQSPFPNIFHIFTLEPVIRFQQFFYVGIRRVMRRNTMVRFVPRIVPNLFIGSLIKKQPSYLYLSGAGSHM
jgi:hypothetical protein